MMTHQVDLEIGGKQLVLETGRMAKLADGAVTARYGDTVVLATAVASKVARAGVDFLPLTVDFQEKAYAAGKIPGGFFKREGRPSEREILASRLIDRPLRPLFPKGFYFDIQVIASVLSADQGNVSDLLAIIAASAALTISDIPLKDPVASVRIGRIEGRFVTNPSFAEIEASDLNLVVAGTQDAVMMVEGGAHELSEQTMIDAISLAHAEIKKIIQIVLKLRELVGKPKREPVQKTADPSLVESVKSKSLKQIEEAVLIPNKTARQERLEAVLKGVADQINTPEADRTQEITEIFHELERNAVRQMILTKGVRADGRGCSAIRPITCEVGILPRTHGSALFTRGETQSLAVVTLGTAEDEQRIDALEGESTKTFMLHYNFPPFSVGEARPMRGPGRREIGHGALAERALRPVIPSREAFPYTLRIVSDILESNGSSSMATVCGGTLALMDAGVQIKAPVAGIAMGLIKEGPQTVILSDILGLEDHLGDMDFKVTGTRQGVTALQMDMKIPGITESLFREALEQARIGRLHILDRMAEALAAPRPDLSPLAPRIFTMHVKKDMIGAVIGPGGKVVRGIVEKTGVKIDIEDDGTILIASADAEAAKLAMEMIGKITEEVEVGKIYKGKVVKIMDFGAFVEILPGTDGLVHISQLAEHRVNRVQDEVKEGDEILVKVLEVDKQGKIRLSRKDVLKSALGGKSEAEGKKG
ncbi:MAG: polyribonucleotide nucleotidyltransferase [Nitrospirae bacterium]|nr:polyribonucleotide nucleotidyltransferase [Nitrospirota bacterium]